jgi:hypothetical protein
VVIGEVFVSTESVIESPGARAALALSSHVRPIWRFVNHQDFTNQQSPIVNESPFTVHQSPMAAKGVL